MKKIVSVLLFVCTVFSQSYCTYDCFTLQAAGKQPILQWNRFDKNTLLSHVSSPQSEKTFQLWDTQTRTCKRTLSLKNYCALITTKFINKNEVVVIPTSTCGANNGAPLKWAPQTNSVSNILEKIDLSLTWGVILPSYRDDIFTMITPKGIEVWNTQNEKLLKSFDYDFFYSSLTKKQWNPQEDIIAFTDVKKLILMNIRTRETTILDEHETHITDIAWHPKNPSIIASAQRDEVRVHHACKTPQTIKRHLLKAHIDSHPKISWSPTGSFLAVGYDKRIDIFYVNYRTLDLILIETLHGHTNDILQVAWSPNDNMVIASSECNSNLIRIWSLKNI